MKHKYLFILFFIAPFFLSAQLIERNEQKFAAVLEAINYAYVDNADQTKLTEKAIEGLLKELDPHSVYIPAEELKEMNEPLVGNFEGVGRLLNEQIDLELASSQYYLAMASWCEVQGYDGISKFLYKHADEERMHMLKLFHYINERGGHALVPAIEAVPKDFNSLSEIFEKILTHELKVTNEINNLVDVCLTEKDYTTHNFLQWYVAEQIEEERLARNLLDKLKLIGNDKGGLYLFDRDILSFDQG
jgi:ferritin